MHSSKHIHLNTRYLTYVRYDTCAGCSSPGLINVLQTLITQLWAVWKIPYHILWLSAAPPI